MRIILFLVISFFFSNLAFSQIEDNSPNKFKVDFDTWKHEGKDLITFQKEEDVKFPVLYKGTLFGMAAYGIELGYSRLFALNRKGKIVDVIPEDGFPERGQTYLFLKNLLSLTNSK